MDTNTITHVSLCSGYGGIDLGLKRAIGRSLRTVAYVEVESFAVANLVAKASQELLDEAPVWSDLRSFPWGKFHGLVDILSGGYPCQPFSAAGKRLGAEDPRHLWPHISAGIAAMRPSVCFFENVEGHISLGLPDVIEDLAGLGYRTTWGIFSASEVGAPHQRKRVFILAHRNESGWQAGWHNAISSQGRQPHELAACCGDQGGAEELADGERAGLEGQHHRHASSEQAQNVGADAWASGECGAWLLGNANGVGSLDEQQSAQGRGTATAAQSSGTAWPSRPGEQQFAWEPPRVVVDAKSQRANRRLDVCDEECGSRGSLQSEPNDTGREDAAMGQPSSQRCEQAERAVRSEQQPSGTGEECGLGAAEAMGNAEELWRAGLCQDNEGNLDEQLVESADTSQHAGLDNAEGIGWQESGHISGSASESSSRRQTESPLGRDADGPADWLDDAELYTTCDNRTDELRLLGNGVVPATAERAFRVLVGELVGHSESQ